MQLEQQTELQIQAEEEQNRTLESNSQNETQKEQEIIQSQEEGKYDQMSIGFDNISAIQMSQSNIISEQKPLNTSARSNDKGYVPEYISEEDEKSLSDLEITDEDIKDIEEFENSMDISMGAYNTSNILNTSTTN